LIIQSKALKIILYFVKGKYSNAAFKGIVDSPQDREAAARKFFAAVGIEMQSTYFSVSSAEIVVVAEGIAESIAAVKMVTMSAGTFTGLEAIEVNDFSDGNRLRGDFCL
jgi:uncharacterized protein with GYD domain